MVPLGTLQVHCIKIETNSKDIASCSTGHIDIFVSGCLLMLICWSLQLATVAELHAKSMSFWLKISWNLHNELVVWSLNALQLELYFQNGYLNDDAKYGSKIGNVNRSKDSKEQVKRTIYLISKELYQHLEVQFTKRKISKCISRCVVILFIHF